MLQSLCNENSLVLAYVQAYRSVEQKRETRSQPIPVWGKHNLFSKWCIGQGLQPLGHSLVLVHGLLGTRQHRATQQEVSSRQASKASLALSPELCLLPPSLSGPWKNCLKLSSTKQVPKWLGTDGVGIIEQICTHTHTHTQKERN